MSASLFQSQRLIMAVVLVVVARIASAQNCTPIRDPHPWQAWGEPGQEIVPLKADRSTLFVPEGEIWIIQSAGIPVQDPDNALDPTNGGTPRRFKLQVEVKDPTLVHPNDYWFPPLGTTEPQYTTPVYGVVFTPYYILTANRRLSARVDGSIGTARMGIMYEGWRLPAACLSSVLGVPQPPPPTVTSGVVTPEMAGDVAGASRVFTFQYSASSGASELRTVWLWFNATFASTAANSCLANYDRQAQAMWLINDTGTEWMPAPAASAGSLENSSCAIAWTAGAASTDGTSLVVTLTITFRPSFVGWKNIYLYAAGQSGVTSGWQTRGTYQVQ